MEFFKPQKKDTMLSIMYPEAFYNPIHRVVIDDRVIVPCLRNACPICEIYSATDRAAEFIEAQLDWVTP